MKQVDCDRRNEVFLSKGRKVSPKLVDTPRILTISQRRVLTPEELNENYRDFIEKLAPKGVDSYCVGNWVLGDDGRIRYAIQFLKVDAFRDVTILGFDTLERLMWKEDRFVVKRDGRKVVPVALGAPKLLGSLENQIKSVVTKDREDFVAFCAENHADAYCTSEPESMLDGTERTRYAVQYSNIHPR